MKVEGRTFIGNNIINVKIVEHENPDVRFAKELEESLILVCRELNMPCPMWLSKNTHEFAAFRQTMFYAEQFNQEVSFDRFQFKLID